MADMLQKALKDVTPKEMLDVLPDLATGYKDEYGGVCFHTTLFDKTVPEDQQEFSLVFDDEGGFKLESGHVETELPIIKFHIKDKGGFQTLLRMMLGNEKQATMLWMMGWINVTPGGGGLADAKTIKRTESFFLRIKWGEAALKEAFAKHGITLTDCTIDLPGFTFALGG